jgi:DegV family protein with EDD domain
MSKVAIVTDSTAYIPDNLVQKYSISVAPQVLIWGEDTYEDGVDIYPNEFYSRLANTDRMPSTSQVTPKSFDKIFSNLLEQQYEILAILISEELSGTISSATQTKEEFTDAPIEIVDSHSVAMALGFQVLQAAKAATEGAGLAECKKVAEKARAHVGVIFAVDTLEFLHRGGRIGGASRFLGAALNLKPILEVKDGKIEAIERVRTRKKSLNRLIELVEERISGGEPVRIASLHANSSQDAQYLLGTSIEKFNPVETVFSEVSPVVGTHAGPGTVGLAYCVGM